MKFYFKEKANTSMEERIKVRNKLMLPFINKYGKPVLVHSTHDLKTFKKILVDEQIKLPSQHSSSKKLPLTEKMLGIDNYIYYSLGFVYIKKYNIKQGFLFDLSYLKDLEYYRKAIGRAVYRKFADYLYENDSGYLEKLSNISSVCKKMVNRYLNEEFRGRKRIFFDYWESEKEVYQWARAYKNKNIMKNIIKNIKKENKLNYPYTIKYSKKYWYTEKVPEIISRKGIDLLNSPYFLGFYIEGRISKDVEKILKTKYSGKIIFDGKKIGVIR